MKKILILGIVASGKTTLAKKLSGDLQIPWYELDAVVHEHTTQRKRTPDEQLVILEDLDKKDMWIMEGTYRESYHFLLDKADNIIVINPPLWKRRVRILTRFIKQKIGLEQSGYKPTFSILKKMYIWTNEFEKDKDKFYEILEPYKKKITFMIN
jgi:adenylate kinase family enzyme